MGKPKVPAPRVRDLLQAAMARDETTSVELGERTGLGRAVVGAMLRGETARPEPFVVHQLARHMSVTVAQVLEAYGFDVGVTEAGKLPPDLVSALLRLSPSQMHLVASLVRELADEGPLGPEPDEKESAPRQPQ